MSPLEKLAAWIVGNRDQIDDVVDTLEVPELEFSAIVLERFAGWDHLPEEIGQRKTDHDTYLMTGLEKDFNHGCSDVSPGPSDRKIGDGPYSSSRVGPHEVAGSLRQTHHPANAIYQLRARFRPGFDEKWHIVKVRLVEAVP